MNQRKRLKQLNLQASSLEQAAEAVELERLIGDKERAGRWGERCRGRLEAIQIQQQAIATEIAEIEAQPDEAAEAGEGSIAA